MRHARLTILPLLFILCVGLFGCGGQSTPSESDGKAVMDNMTAAAHVPAHVKSFTKTNGVMQDVGGVKHYTMQYEAELEYTEDVPGPLGEPQIKKGDVKKQTGSMEFQQTEKGWQGQDDKIY